VAEGKTPLFRGLDAGQKTLYRMMYKRIYMRLAKSFTIEADISNYVDETKGQRSASERVNELLRLAILRERHDKLEAEAAEYFAKSKADRSETKALQKAALKTFRRD
jgi:hypothetical protein